MNSLNIALLVNLLGFAVGIALYALIAAMVVRHRRVSRFENVDLLLLTTAVLGLLWNLGELYGFVQKDFALGGISPWLIALSFSALGFLPSVVVHSAQADDARTHWLTYAAYGLSTFAAFLHFYSVATNGVAPSDIALQTLTFGALALAVGLLIFNFRQTLEKKSVWASALLVFAVSSLHLSGEREGSYWYVELVAHQSSLLLALAILSQNYRFAFADLFLKRALSLILIALVALAEYIFIAVPLLKYHETHERNDVQAAALIVGLWVGTAIVYPFIHNFAVWLVDTIILHRVNYAELQITLARTIESFDTIDEVLETICGKLAEVLTAGESSWKLTGKKLPNIGFVSVNHTLNNSFIFIPTAESPFFEIDLGKFYGGRRLLSDEVAMLDGVALVTARRIDALRVTHERCEQEFREQKFSKLATEAQLTALRSQINPHFLFNALTTIGYLIKAEPPKAYDTLLRLTQLLRGVLTSTGEFCTLGEEIRLIESYIDIERARFEEKLSVTIDIPTELENIRVPALILQPLVENAIKHGVSENKLGGEVRISAVMSKQNGGTTLKLSVTDSGAGGNREKAIRTGGVGIRNVEERLASYYGDAAKFSLKIGGKIGTEAVIDLPMKDSIL